MKGYEYQSDFAKKHVADGREQGRVEGAARALLTALRVRGIGVSDATRRRILTQSGLEQLDCWMEKAVLATSLAEVLVEISGGVPLPKEAARQAQDAMATGHNYQWEFARRYFDEGRERGIADGVAHALLIALRARGIMAHESARVRILAQKDLDQLDRWLEKAVVATSLIEVSGEETANEAGRQALESLIKDYDQKRDFAKKLRRLLVDRLVNLELIENNYVIRLDKSKLLREYINYSVGGRMVGDKDVEDVDEHATILYDETGTQLVAALSFIKVVVANIELNPGKIFGIDIVRTTIGDHFGESLVGMYVPRQYRDRVWKFLVEHEVTN